MIKNNGKKVLVLGGTGAMGVYLVPELASMGYNVHVVSLDKVESNNPNITYTQANVKDELYLKELLNNRYDAIVDFMIYSTEEFLKKHKIFLENTSHYIFLSSYRVYANKEIPITEKSPRLLDASEDKEFLATHIQEYSLYKAEQEDILQASGYKNWTIVRPAITYSKLRYQLVTLEANVVVYRAFNKKTVILPRDAMNIQGTMSWAGDVAKMFSRIILNKKTYNEVYTISTAEHHSWEEIANYYKELIGLDYVIIDTEKYLSLYNPAWGKGPRYQLMYDRCFNRVIDNIKILQVTGLKQSDFTSLKDGLKKELSVLPRDTNWSKTSLNDSFDKWLKDNNR